MQRITLGDGAPVQRCQWRSVALHPLGRGAPVQGSSCLGRNRPFEFEPEWFEIQSVLFFDEVSSENHIFEISGQKFKILNAKRCGDFETAVSLDTSSKKPSSTDFETFGSDFEMALPPRTSSELELQAPLRFLRGSALLK